MKLVLDTLPIILFFICYKFFGLMSATKLIIMISIIQIIIMRIVVGKFEKMTIVSGLSIAILGGATLLFDNEIFIKWKPTVIYWSSAVAFFVSHFLKTNLAQRIGGKAVELSANEWQNLNISWVIFFSIMGLANLYVAYNCSTSFWVNFKLFGTLGTTIIFVIGQSIYMTKKRPNV